MPKRTSREPARRRQGSGSGAGRGDGLRANPSQGCFPSMLRSDYDPERAKPKSGPALPPARAIRPFCVRRGLESRPPWHVSFGFMSGTVDLMFRAMTRAVDGLPSVGRSARELGVRVAGPFRDIPSRPDGTVLPGTGGMSVALGAPANLPKHRRPKPLGGEGRDPVFTISSARLPRSLSVRASPYPHAFVEPSQPCGLTDFEAAIASTRQSWRLV